MRVPAWPLLVILLVYGLQKADAQKPNVSRCRTSDVELLDGGGSGEMGHGYSMFEVRNTSSHACTLKGSPALRFFDQHGNRLFLTYGDAPSGVPGVEDRVVQVRLRPGGFAHFQIATQACNGEPFCIFFTRIKVVLPGERSEMNVGGGYRAVLGVGISPIVAGCANSSEPPDACDGKLRRISPIE